jgi:RNA polymerase sigma factor (TIGR02999 family)
MSEVVHILSAIEQGDPQAAERLLPHIYEELRKLAAQKLAHEKPGQTLQPTALVHEAYLRLVKGEDKQQWNSRGHFFAAAAEAMRRILVERARTRKLGRVSLEQADPVLSADSDDVLALHEALSRLEELDPNAAQLVKLRYFAGMDMKETAEAMNVALRTAEREWTFARTWLHRELCKGNRDTRS